MSAVNYLHFISFFCSIFSFLAIHFPSVAQSPPQIDVEVVTNIYQDVTQPEAERTLAALQLANYYIYEDVEKATDYIDWVLAEGRNERYLLSENNGQGFLIKGWTYQARFELPEAQVWMQRAIDVERGHVEVDRMAELTINYVSTLKDQNDPSTIDKLDDLHQSMIPIAGYAGSRTEYLLQFSKGSALGNLQQTDKAYRHFVKLLNHPVAEDKEERLSVLSAMARLVSSAGDPTRTLHIIDRNNLLDEITGFAKQWTLITYATAAFNAGEDEKLDTALDELEQMALPSESDRTQVVLLRSKLLRRQGYLEEALNLLKSVDEEKLTATDKERAVRFLIFKSRLLHELDQRLEACVTVDELMEVVGVDDYDVLPPQSHQVMLARLSCLVNGRNYSLLQEFSSEQSEYYRNQLESEVTELQAKYDLSEAERDRVEVEKALIQQQELTILQRWLTLASVLLLFAASIAAYLFYRGQKKERTIRKMRERENTRLQRQNLDLISSQKLLEKRLGRLIDPRKDFLLVPGKNDIRQIAYHEIIYIATEGRGCRVFALEDASFPIAISLKDVLAKLPSALFYHSFRSIIINLSMVEIVHKNEIVLKDGHTVRLSKEKYLEIKSILSDI